jgi:hypothetical protein
VSVRSVYLSVLVGGDPNGETTPHDRYLPSCCFKPRRTLAGGPATLAHGSAFSVQTSAPGNIARSSCCDRARSPAASTRPNATSAVPSPAQAPPPCKQPPRLTATSPHPATGSTWSTRPGAVYRRLDSPHLNQRGTQTTDCWGGAMPAPTAMLRWTCRRSRQDLLHPHAQTARRGRPLMTCDPPASIGGQQLLLHRLRLQRVSSGAGDGHGLLHAISTAMRAEAVSDKPRRYPSAGDRHPKARHRRRPVKGRGLRRDTPCASGQEDEVLRAARRPAELGWLLTASTTDSERQKALLEVTPWQRSSTGFSLRTGPGTRHHATSTASAVSPSRR